MIFKDLTLHLEKDFSVDFMLQGIPSGATLTAQFSALDKQWTYPVAQNMGRLKFTVPKADIAEMKDSLANRFGSWFTIANSGGKMEVLVNGNFAITTILGGKQ